MSYVYRSLTEQSDSAHEFGALNTLLLVVVLGLCILSAYLIKQNNFYYLPESAAAIMVGLLVGGLARLVYPSEEELHFLTFEPEMFFFILLPPIIFEAGYTLKKKDFFANFWTISLFAVAGTIVSTFTIGYLVYFIGLTGMVEIDTSSPMEALLFGALISAVDPVATLSVMGNPKLNCDPLLYSLVFGESVLNDAVAIVLFNTFMTFYDSGEEFTTKTIPQVLLRFTGISLGSVLVGIIIGLICSYLCKNTQMSRYPEYEMSMIFLFAYGSYSFSESMKLSGIMSLFFCAVTMSHYNSHNLSSTSQVTSHYIFKSLACLSEFFVYLYMGMGFFTGRFRKWNFFFVVLCIMFCLFARALNSFPFSALANLFRFQQIPPKMKIAIWFAGLRGAIAFALSQNMPGESTDLYVSTTLSIVIFTTIVCGGLTEPMLSRMGMRGQPLTEAEQATYESHANLRENFTDPSASVSDNSRYNASAFWSMFDNSYMKPYFGGSSNLLDDDELDGDGIDDSRGIKRRMASNPSIQLQAMSGSSSPRTFHGALPVMHSSSSDYEEEDEGEMDEERNTSASSTRSPPRVLRSASSYKNKNRSSGHGGEGASSGELKGKGVYTPPAGAGDDLEL